MPKIEEGPKGPIDGSERAFARPKKARPQHTEVEMMLMELAVTCFVLADIFWWWKR